MKPRERAWRRGRRAETLCAWLLRLKGYRIVARGFRAPVGEIDIVATRRGVLVAVEVKARDRRTTAAEAISARQQARVRRAAEAFISRHPEHANSAIRFDAMLVAPYRIPVHLIDAWRA